MRPVITESFLVIAQAGAAPPARLMHRLPSLNGVVPEHPPAIRRDRRARQISLIDGKYIPYVNHFFLFSFLLR